MIEVQGITKRFGGVTALSDVRAEIHDGEVVAIIGENGAGKSTLMKIFAGVYKPDAGEIMIDGKAARFRSPSDSLEAGIRVIYQELSVLDNLDVTANVFLGREILVSGILLDRREMESETARIFKRLDLNINPRARVSELSLAERQLVEIARALSMKVRVLILDEPTSSLTLDETRKLLDLVRELKYSGVTVLYVSHRLDEIQQIADRVIGLRDGKNAGELRKEEINQEAMIQMMVGRKIEQAEIRDTNPNAAVRLSLRGLRTRRYANQTIDLELRSGEILGVAGLVGSGRTEVVEAVFGIKPAISGELVLDGKTIHVNCPSDAIKAGICLIPEDRRKSGLSVTMSVKDNISMPILERFSKFGLIGRRREVDWATTQVSRFGVKTASIEVPAINLSGGNQQKVVIARWLSLSPKVILFDEPTRGVDVGARSSIYEEMRSLASTGAAIWMVSSDMEEILAVSDRIAVMNEGRITGILNRAEATEEKIMALAVAGEQQNRT